MVDNIEKRPFSLKTLCSLLRAPEVTLNIIFHHMLRVRFILFNVGLRRGASERRVREELDETGASWVVGALRKKKI